MARVQQHNTTRDGPDRWLYFPMYIIAVLNPGLTLSAGISPVELLPSCHRLCWRCLTGHHFGEHTHSSQQHCTEWTLETVCLCVIRVLRPCYWPRRYNSLS
jgi:hypothetical protein